MTDAWRHEPRWPAATPAAPHGPGPGRWRDGPGGGESKAAHTAAWVARLAERLGGHRHGLMSHEDVASYGHRTDYEVVGRAGGQHGSVEFRRYSDGRMLAHKTHLADHEQEQNAEIEASIIGHALGARVPAAVRDPNDPEHGLLMEYLPDDMGRGVGETATDDQALARRRAVRDADTPASHLLGLFDAIIDNHDRHGGNLRMHQGDYAGIDHGGAFGHQAYRGGSQHEITGFRMASSGSRLATKLFEVQMHRGQSRIAQTHYSKAAIQEARRRIEAVKDQLRPETWAGVDKALSVIEDASGSRGASLD